MSDAQFQHPGTHLPWQGKNLITILYMEGQLPEFYVLLELCIRNNWYSFFLFINSFIENFGTHIITAVTIGGKDVIYVKQHQSSPLSKMEMKNYVQDIGSQRFSPTETHTSSGLLKYKDKASSFISLNIP